MSKRLQVVVGDTDLTCYERTARAAGVSLSEWVRQALSVAQREASSGDVDAKLAVIRKAASYEIGGREVDIETMLAETEAGRLAEIEAGLAGADDV
ncbi:MAG: antitoxin [Solirubrobacteraceae bacterium]